MNIIQSEYTTNFFFEISWFIIQYIKKNVFNIFAQNYQIFLWCLECKSSIYMIVKNVILLFPKFLKHFIFILQFSKNSFKEWILSTQWIQISLQRSVLGFSFKKERLYHSIFEGIKFILVSWKDFVLPREISYPFAIVAQ